MIRRHSVQSHFKLRYPILICITSHFVLVMSHHQYYTVLHCPALFHLILLFTPLHITPSHSIPSYFMHYMASHWIRWHETVCYVVTLSCDKVDRFTWCCITMHQTTSHCAVLPCVALLSALLDRSTRSADPTHTSPITPHLSHRSLSHTSTHPTPHTFLITPFSFSPLSHSLSIPLSSQRMW